MQREEIQPGELCRYASEVMEAVEVICKSSPFRTSAKSRQFLRHIVQRTLNGSVDELKERLIGIVLLGRETSYDTGSDAGVRVRANDVRKRLAAYYAANSTDREFTIDLPAGTYVPRFYLPRVFQSDRIDTETSATLQPQAVPLSLLQVPELSLQQLALPTLVALFLCIICIRWQLTREHPFVTFWNTVFQDHHALLYVPLANPGGQQGVIPANTVEDTAPLFNLAGQFHARIAFTRTLDPVPDAKDIVILIGAVPTSPRDAASSSSAREDVSSAEGSRLVVDSSPFGRKIVDHGGTRAGATPYARAALLTIANGSEPSIHIDGTDAAAVDSLIKRLCEPDAFPVELIDSFQQGTVTQIVFPLEPQAQAVVFHEALPATHTAMNGPL